MSVIAQHSPDAGNRLIIAWGNPQRADDAIGLAVAEEFAQSWPDAARVICCQQLVPELADEIAAAGAVAFVDAEWGTPGQICIRPVSPSSPGNACLGHVVSAEMLLAYAQELYGQTPRASLLTIGAVNYDLHVGLTPAVAAAIASAMEHLRAWFCLGSA